MVAVGEICEGRKQKNTRNRLVVTPTIGPTARVGIMPPRKREKEKKRKSPRKQKAAVLTTAVLTAASKTRRTRGPPGRERKNIDLG